MYKIRNYFIIVLTLVLAIVTSCKDLDELNINPNGVDPEKAGPNLLMATVITGISGRVLDMGFGDISGVIQHTQKDGWAGGHNDYDWAYDDGSQNWSSYYSILRNTKEMYGKASEMNLDFHKGVALVIEAYAFGLIADLWGDAPFSKGVNGEAGGEENLKPVYDNQKDIYLGILAKLDSANTLLSKGKDSYSNINSTQDVLYNGDPSKWQKFANSLALRYYMRLSEKESGIAQAGIEKITSDPSTYPVITDADDDAKVDYIGAKPSDSWPSNTVYDVSDNGRYFRTKMCATLIEKLQSLNDPRIAVWANKIEIPIFVDSTKTDGSDVIINGIRNVSLDVAEEFFNDYGVNIDQDPEYVGIPASINGAQFFNLSPDPGQGTYNPHVSQLNDIYKESSGDLLVSRIMSAAEVNFILAEAALKGWTSGDPETYYNSGVEQSLIAWGVGDAYDDYIAGAPYVGLEEIMEQKWIASWTASAEAWFDWRRTGLPDLKAGPNAKRPALPLRFYYTIEEKRLNEENMNVALERLELTDYTSNDGKNSAWSKMWLLQGTNKPY